MNKKIKKERKERAQYSLHSLCVAWPLKRRRRARNQNSTPIPMTSRKFAACWRSSVRILFIRMGALSPPNDHGEVDSARKYKAQFDGIGPSQLDGFAQF